MVKTLEPPTAQVAKAETTAAKMLASLDNLSKATGDNVYKLTTIARSLLADHVWIADFHGGDQGVAMDFLQDRYFGMASLSLHQLLKLLEEFPSQAKWKQCNYRLATLWAEWEERNAKPKKDKDAADKPVMNAKIIREKDEEINRVRAELASEGRIRAQQETDLQRSQQRIMELEKLVSEQNGRIKELERQIERLSR